MSEHDEIAVADQPVTDIEPTAVSDESPLEAEPTTGRRRLDHGLLAASLVIATGIVLIIYGASAADSLGSDFSRLFTGAPTDQAIWLLVGGIAAVAVGAGSLILGSKTR